jgi:hypothetical protein
VVGGCGGAGASTLAACLAVAALGLGRRTALFDADTLGGGLDRLVASATTAAPLGGGAGDHGAWPHESGPPRRAYDRDLALVAWGVPDGESIPVTGMRNALRDLRSKSDLVVVDLPRAIDDAAQLALSEATHTLVIAPVSERAAVATARLLPKLMAIGPRPELVVRLPGRDDLTPRGFADLLNLPLAGVVRSHRGRVRAPDQFGRRAVRFAVSFDRFSRRFLERCERGRLGVAATTQAAAV